MLKNVSKASYVSGAKWYPRYFYSFIYSFTICSIAFALTRSIILQIHTSKGFKLLPVS